MELHLVDQNRGAQRLAGRPSPELPVGQASQLVVDQREKPVEGSAASLAGLPKDFRNRALLALRPSP